MKRNCFGCRHMDFMPGSPNYSSDTPGCDAYIRCMKKHFMNSLSDIGETEFFRLIRQAETCPDFEEAEG